MSEISIKKAKLNSTKKGTSLVISYEEIDNTGDKILTPGQTHSAIIQKEIQEQFDRLAIHLAIMAGYVRAGDVQDIAMPDTELSKGFIVKQFSIGGDEGEGTDGVVLSGSKILPGGKSHNFNTPFYRFNEGEASRYMFMDDLIAALNVLEDEIIAYKKGEKRGQPIQGELNLKDPKDADPEAMERVKEMDNEKPKKEKPKSVKKVAQSAEVPSGEVVQ
jgi:hypothetical protein